MSRKCYVCGKIISEGSPYYSAGHHTYVCSNDGCFNFYFWDELAARMVCDKHHEYVIVDGRVYQIGSDKDEPRAFDGKFWAIQFNDGTYIETTSLWLKGELPERLQHDFPDNAHFVAH